MSSKTAGPRNRSLTRNSDPPMPKEKQPARSDKGLPANIEAERLVLGSIMLDDGKWDLCLPLKPEDFSLEKHRIIFRRMGELHERGSAIDHVTVAEELDRCGELAMCGGLSYLVSLDDGLPDILNLDSYVRIVQEKSVLRRTIYACRDIANRCLLATDSSQEILAEAESLLARIGEKQQAHGEWYKPGQVVETYPGGINAFLQPSRGGIGLTTPWKALDEAICGLQAGDLIIVAGRPSMGKSVLAMQIAHHAAKHDTGVAFFSLEMSKESLVYRLVAGEARVDLQRIRKNCLSAEERRKVQRGLSEVWAEPLFIDDTRARTVSAQAAAIRKLNAKYPVGLVVIDHLQLMKGGAGGRTDQKRNQEIGDIVHAQKHLAGDLKVPVVLLSQLNRDCETDDRKPIVPDLKESGDIEQDADIVVFVHRWEQYAKHMHNGSEAYCRKCGAPNHRGQADLIIGKQRNGPIGEIPMTFLKSYQRFEERADEMAPLEEG
jgi:replicative DNA helicase